LEDIPLPEGKTTDERLNELYVKYAVRVLDENASVKGEPEKSEAPEEQEESDDDVSDPALDHWDRSIAFTLAHEGGKNYTGRANGTYKMKNPADKGGPTNMGITKPTLAAAFKGNLVPHNDLDILTYWEAKVIYGANFWDKFQWGELPWPVCLCCFDISVNHGGFAFIIQRAVNSLGGKLTVDGRYGPLTKAALWKAAEKGPKALTQALLDFRRDYYDRIIASDPSQEKNKKGWYKRNNDMAEAAWVEGA
jgi:lysozyme family protein